MSSIGADVQLPNGVPRIACGLYEDSIVLADNAPIQLSPKEGPNPRIPIAKKVADNFIRSIFDRLAPLI